MSPWPDLPLAGWGGPAVHPGLVFLVGAVLVGLLGRRWAAARRVITLGTPLVGLAALLTLTPGAGWELQVRGLDVSLLRVDRLSTFFALLLNLGALLAAIYGLRVRGTTEHVAALAYAAASHAAVFAGDLLTLFVAWEAMTVASAFLVFGALHRAAVSAGIRYLLFQILSGLFLLAGALLAYQAHGSTAFDAMTLGEPWTWLILLAFGIKCGFPFLHTWITDAYPQSTPTGTVYLSVFTTKVAVYALARGFPGADVLVLIGMAMALFPIFYAVIENDLRRVLAYSMINQIGFMVVGIGVGTELALNGAVAHAFNEVLFKGLLFMAMGAVLARAGTVGASDLGGLYRTMPATTVFCVVGALSISAFPLFNAFVSKGMILAAVLYEGHVGVWLVLLFASAGVFHHAGIKVPFFAFFAHDSGRRPVEAPREMITAMALAAVGCVAIGIHPPLLAALLPWSAEYAVYTYAHVLLQLQLLAFAALAFAVMKLSGVYPAEIPSVNLDADWLVRRLGRGMVQAVDEGLGTRLRAAGASLRSAALRTARRAGYLLGPGSPLGGQRPIAWSGLLVAIALLSNLLIHTLRGRL